MEEGEDGLGLIEWGKALQHFGPNKIVVAQMIFHILNYISPFKEIDDFYYMITNMAWNTFKLLLKE